MNRAVYYREYEGATEIAVTEEGVLQHFYRLQAGFLTGAIAVGRVKFVKKQVGVFVELGLEKDGLMPYRDGRKAGDYVLCQVKREPTPEKGCALTEKITLAGRYVVLNDVGEWKFSRKLSEETKVGLFGAPRKEPFGFIFRSACEEGEKEAVFAECETLIERYEALQKEGRTRRSVGFLYRDDGESVARRYARTDEELSADFSAVEKEVAGLGARKVETHGVELVFDKTEAMTVVDVNFHRYAGGEKDVEDAALAANKLAARELCRQLRLRNVGGVVMVDFISMKRNESMEELSAFLTEELQRDNVRTSLELVKSVGMFAIVRTKRYDAL